MKKQSGSASSVAPSGASRVKIGHFDICKAMAQRNMDIRMSPLQNISDLNYRPKRKGTDVTIGIDGNLVAEIGLQNKFVGGLLLCDQREYFEMKKTLEREMSQGASDDATPQAGEDL